MGRKNLEIVNISEKYVDYRAKLFKYGNSYAFRVPKPLIDGKILAEGLYVVRVKRKGR